MVVEKKIVVLLIMLVFSGGAIAQKTPVIKIKRSDFEKAGRIQDVIKDIPSDCKVTSYVFSLVVAGSEKSMVVNNEALMEIKGLVNPMSQKKLFFEDIKSNCRSKHKNKYTIILE